MPVDRRTTTTHCQTVRGHLLARIVVPNVGHREVPTVATEIGEALESLGSAAKGQAFVLDFTDVRILSSMGLGMCVDLKKRADKMGMKSVLFGADAPLLDLMKLMRVDRLYTVIADSAGLQRFLG